MDRAQDEVQLRVGGQVPGEVGEFPGRAKLQAHADGEPALKLGAGDGELLLHRGPAEGEVGLALGVDEVAVVGEAQLGKAGLYRRLGQLCQGGGAVEGAEGVGVVISEKHGDSSLEGPAFQPSDQGLVPGGDSETDEDGVEQGV